MSFNQIILLSFCLATSNIIAILLGTEVYLIADPFSPFFYQTPLAFIFNLAIFFIFIRIIVKLEAYNIHSSNFDDVVFIFLYTLVCTPCLYAILFFIAKGSWCGFNQIMQILFYQIPANLFILFLHHYFYGTNSLKG